MKTEEWLDLFSSKDGKLLSCLKNIYGNDEILIESRIELFLSAGREFKKIYGTGNDVNFVRAPGRLNTLAMHSDHRGTFINPISLNREIVLCYENRDDGDVEIHNLEQELGARKFGISEDERPVVINDLGEWLSWTQTLTDKRKNAGTNEDWINKLKAAPVYLERVVFKGKKIRGINGVMSGDIPQQAGLSSSSSVIVAMMDAVLDANSISVEYKDFAHHCGIAEYYVGTRGGCGDHAAIKYGRLGMITHMKTTPELVLDSYIPFPEGYNIIIFNSGIRADKTGRAGEKFNEKVAAYEIGEIYLRGLIKERYPEIYSRIVSSRERLVSDVKKFHLGDIVDNFSEPQIYEMIEMLPEKTDRKTLMEELNQHGEFLKKQFATHSEPTDGYKVRQVLLYGISEALRGKIVDGFLKKGDIRMYGELMNVSHDGDRVHNLSATAKRLKNSLDRSVELWKQPGDYECSIKEIDEMVDICRQNGAVGAQISGAGMGGSMMALVEKGKVDGLRDAVREEYYGKKNIKENYIIAVPVEGAGKLLLDES